MEKFDKLKAEYIRLSTIVAENVNEEKIEEEFMLYTIAASISIWSKNELYSTDYAKALKAISEKDYSIDQILTAMSCSMEEDRALVIPTFFKQMVKCYSDKSEYIKKWIEDYYMLLVSMALINGDFTVEEANTFYDIVGEMSNYCQKNGVDISLTDISFPCTTEINQESYLINNDCKNENVKTVKDDYLISENVLQYEKKDKQINDNDNHISISLVFNDSEDGEFSKENNNDESYFSNTKVIMPEEKSEETLDSLLEELDKLVGLENVKKDVHSLINFIRISQLRKERGIKAPTISYHLVFTGNPGTGKTTVARLIAKLYYHMGILPTGQLVETDRSSLVAGYLGQTAIKTQEVIKKAIGGVLFIDEAYSLASDSEDSYGKEAIETILKAMEDHRDEIVVIVAGYTNLMHKFISSNPGLSSRFNKYFEFDDFSKDELLSIFTRFCDSNGYKLDEDSIKLLKEHFEILYENRDEHFGNARAVRNLFERVINEQANRLAKMDNISNYDLENISAEDINTVLGGKA